MTYDQGIVEQHCQQHQSSCIASCIEMILKLLGKVPNDYYALQEKWQQYGSFGDFNGNTIHEIIFHQEFAESRGPEFPIIKLFQRIDQEIEAGRFVGVSLTSGMGRYHMYLIYDKTTNGYAAFSKNFQATINESNVREIIIQMEGTDILTYKL